MFTTHEFPTCDECGDLVPGPGAVSVAFKRRGPARLAWVGMEYSTGTAWDAYQSIMKRPAVRQLLARGYREYGVQGLGASEKPMQEEQL